MRVTREVMMHENDIQFTDKILNRFWIKVHKTDLCWYWRGATTRTTHGRFKIAGKMFGPHRISYVIHKGPIPKGMMICHKCDNGACVNPEHLFLGTAIDNMQDCKAKKRSKKFKIENPNKYNGVRYDKSRQGWISYVYLNRKLIDIGRHISEIDAARNHDRIKYMKYGMKDDLNFPFEYNLKD